MEPWAIALITSLGASIVTGAFTLLASLGAQKRAVQAEKEHRFEDQKLVENRVQLRAVADFLSISSDIRNEWKREATKRRVDDASILGTMGAAFDALAAREPHLRTLHKEAKTLQMYIHDPEVSTGVVTIIHAINSEIKQHSADIDKLNTLDRQQTDKLHDLTMQVLQERDDEFDKRFGHGANLLFRSSRERFWSTDPERFKGMFTPPY